MQIVDAQIHLWGTGLPSNPSHWPVTSFTAEEAIVLMDEAGVHGAVIHPPHWDPGSPGPWTEHLANRSDMEPSAQLAEPRAVPLPRVRLSAHLQRWLSRGRHCRDRLTGQPGPGLPVGRRTPTAYEPRTGLGQ